MGKESLKEAFAKQHGFSVDLLRKALTGARNMSVKNAVGAADTLGIDTIVLIDPNRVEDRKAAWREYENRVANNQLHSGN